MKIIHKILVCLLVNIVLVGSCRAGGDLYIVPCYELEVIYARGSGGEQYGTAEFDAVSDATAKISNDYNLPSRALDLDYPAIDVGNPVRLIGAFVSAGKAYEFGDSVRAGVESLKELYRTRRAECPEMKFILVGYSQGAMVVSQALTDFNADDVKFIMLLGDPNTYLPEGEGAFPEACNGGSLSDYRTFAPNCRTYEGVFGGRKPYELPALSGKYSLWCNIEDYICGSSKNPLKNSGHLAYANKIGWGMAHLARKYLEKYTPTEVRPLGLRLASFDDSLKDDSLVDELGGANIEAPSNITVWREGNVLKMKWRKPDIAEDLLLKFDGVDLGYVSAGLDAFEIRDVDFGRGFSLSLAWMDSEGELGEALELGSGDLVNNEPVLSGDDASDDIDVSEPELPHSEADVRLDLPLSAPAVGTNKMAYLSASPMKDDSLPGKLATKKDSDVVINRSSRLAGFGFLDKTQMVSIVISMLSAGGLLIIFIMRKRRG